jgi:RND family efflux transporter MFP subunit
MAAWSRRNGWWVLIAIALCGAASMVFWRPHTQAAALEQATPVPPSAKAAGIRVSTVSPASGGLPRRATLPCSAHWYEVADLYARVSGYLERLDVDIGSRVTEGQTLATVDVPELEQDVALADAAVHQATAEVKQTAARKKTAAAELRAADAATVRAQADVARWEAERSFREKEYQRFRDLTMEEKLFQFQSVEAGRRAAETAVLTAKEQALAAAARVEQSDADLEVQQAKASVAQANLAKAKLMASFTKIAAPFDGLITARKFHRGAFVRAADKGGDMPLLTVARTDLMRVVVQIPDRDVPFAQPGDAVQIEFDALPGREFEGKLARISNSEDVSTRTMRAEVDLPNEKSRIFDQMYGRMQIDLEPAGNTLTLPSACLVGDLKEGRGQVFVVREGVARLQVVAIGPDNGIQIEIVDGLSTADAVIVKPPAGLTEGTAVTVEKIPPSK